LRHGSCSLGSWPPGPQSAATMTLRRPGGRFSLTAWRWCLKGNDYRGEEEGKGDDQRESKSDEASVKTTNGKGGKAEKRKRGRRTVKNHMHADSDHHGNIPPKPKRHKVRQCPRQISFFQLPSCPPSTRMALISSIHQSN
jgi:hypothetical protein